MNEKYSNSVLDLGKSKGFSVSNNSDFQPFNIGNNRMISHLEAPDNEKPEPSVIENQVIRKRKTKKQPSFGKIKSQVS